MFPEKISDITAPLTTRDAIGDLPLNPVQSIETNVQTKKATSTYQKFMQGEISPEIFVNTLKSRN